MSLVRSIFGVKRGCLLPLCPLSLEISYDWQRRSQHNQWISSHISLWDTHHLSPWEYSHSRYFRCWIVLSVLHPLYRLITPILILIRLCINIQSRSWWYVYCDVSLLNTINWRCAPSNVESLPPPLTSTTHDESYQLLHLLVWIP